MHGLPEIDAGDPLGELIARRLASAGVEPAAADIVAVAQKAVSKAEGRVRELDDVVPGRRRASSWRDAWARTRAWSS